jgi:hypothetical protein
MSRRFHNRDDGAVAVVVAFCSILLIGVGALAVDVGNLYSVRRESQRTADLAALAGAQDLPLNATLACQDALKYLDANKPGYDASNLTVPNPTGYGINPSTCGSSGTSDGKTVKISADALTIEVKVPDQQVSLGLAAVFGYGKGYTAAGATVQIRSPGHILPFALTLCKYSGYVSVKAGSGQTSSCADSSQGDFGFLDIPRTGLTGTNNILAANIDQGIDHAVDFLKPWPTSNPTPTIVPNTECKDIAPSGVTVPLKDTGPTDGANCLDVENGLTASVITDGLIEHSNKACDGRLTRVRPGAVTSTVHTCTIDNDPFLTFLVSGATLAQATAGTLPDGAVSQDVLSSPNFFVVPVLNANEHPRNGFYPIRDFAGFYLDCFDDQSSGLCTDASQAGTNQIKRMFGYAFDLDGIGGVSADDGDTNIYYGGGVRVPVLVK